MLGLFLAIVHFLLLDSNLLGINNCVIIGLNFLNVIFMKKVAVIGLGYVGFPLLCAISKSGKYNTVGFDLSDEKISLINSGVSPIDDERAESDLKEIEPNVSVESGILEDSDLFIVCVPTPVDNDHTPNLEFVSGAALTVSKYLKKGGIVVIESTVNPGVCDEVVIPLLEKETGMKAGFDFHVAHCPERINPGDQKWNVYNISRNVGATTPMACKEVADFYRSVIEAEVIEMSSLKTAEATKIVENTFRDINIAYVNELARSFDILGIDLLEVINAASNKPFAFMPHYPGCGVGGHCIPVDPYYLIARAKKSGFEHRFLSIARDINNSMPAYTVDLLIGALNKIGKSVKGTKIGILGISYKADVADKRESPSFQIIDLIKKLEGDLLVYDPYFPDESDVADVDELLKNVEAIVLVTSHKEFERLSEDTFIENDIKVLIDGKNIYKKEAFADQNIVYRGIGRGTLADLP